MTDADKLWNVNDEYLFAYFKGEEKLCLAQEDGPDAIYWPEDLRVKIECRKGEDVYYRVLTADGKYLGQGLCESYGRTIPDYQRV